MRATGRVSEPDWTLMRELRFLASVRDGSLRRLFTVKLARDDLSFYLFPRGLKGEFHFGVAGFGDGRKELTFKFKGQHASEKAPKVSFHPNGAIKVAGGRSETLALGGATFASLRGEHIATVRVDGLSAAPVHEKGPVAQGSRRDAVTHVPSDLPSLRIVVCANSQRPSFPKETEVTGGRPWVLPILRSPSKLFLGFFVIDNSEFTKGGGSGTTIIAGWDGRNPNAEEMRFLYLRAS